MNRLERLQYCARQANNDLLLLSVALRAYHEREGKYPASLSQLQAVGIKSVLNDPFTDHKPYSYSRKGRSYVLYSIGPDAIDQGGQPVHYRYAFISPNATGDIVPGH